MLLKLTSYLISFHAIYDISYRIVRTNQTYKDISRSVKLISVQHRSTCTSIDDHVRLSIFSCSVRWRNPSQLKVTIVLLDNPGKSFIILIYPLSSIRRNEDHLILRSHK